MFDSNEYPLSANGTDLDDAGIREAFLAGGEVNRRI